MARQLDIVSSTRTHRRPLTVSVEGNIGSGKSTFLSYCDNDAEVTTLPEPVGLWTNVGGVNLLENYYNDPMRYGMALQLHVNLTMQQQYRSRTFRNIKVIERSLLSARHCFQRIMVNNGTLEPVMGTILDQWHDHAMESYDYHPHVIVYLHTEPAVALQRVRSRGRPEENSITLAYLQQLHIAHENWIGHIHQQHLVDESDITVITINANRPISDMVPDFDRCLHDLKLLNL